MTTNKKGYLYYKSDKDVFDALHKTHFGKNVLREQLQNKGILISHNDDKEDIIDYASPIMTNYHDQHFIIDKLNSTASKKTYTNSTLSTTTADVEIQEVLKVVKKDFENGNDSFNITKLENDTFIVNCTHTESDLSKNVMSQNTTTTTEVEIWSDENNQIKIRGLNNNKSKEIVNALKHEIKQNDTESEEFLIELSAITSSDLRNRFFQNLIQGLKGYKVVDVKSVATSTMSNPEHATDGSILPYVKDLILKGNSVMQSKSFAELVEADFYIARIEWTVESELLSGDKIDFFAEFSDRKNCTGFNYAPLRVYKRKGSTNEFSLSYHKPSNIESKNLLPIIEESAKNSLEFIQGEFVNEDD